MAVRGGGGGGGGVCNAIRLLALALLPAITAFKGKHASDPLADAAVDAQRQVVVTPAERAVEAVDGIIPSCTCDCCSVVEQTPDLVTVDANGNIVKHHCALPKWSPTDAENELHSSECPELCLKGNGMQTDLSQHCDVSCHPMAATTGSKCGKNKLKKLEIAPVSDGPSVMGSVADSGNSGGAATAVVTEAPAAAWAKPPPPKKLAPVGQLKTEIIWDKRKVVAERLRAEAGAAMASAANSGEQVREAKMGVERDNKMIAKLRGAVQPIQGAVTKGAADAKAESKKAQASAADISGILKKAEADSPALLAGARELAVTTILEKAEQAADAQALAYTQRMNWDKPDAYARIVAYQGGEPYAQGAALALRRITEYRVHAQQLRAQAAGDRAAAASIPREADEMMALGDRLGAASAEGRIKDLIGNAGSLEAAAKDADTKVVESQAASNDLNDQSRQAIAATYNRYLWFRATPAPPIVMYVAPAPAPIVYGPPMR